MNVLLDANVLYSITLTDTMLSLAEAKLFVPLWTERLLDEARRNVVPVGDPYVEQRFVAMRRSFRTAMIAADRYDHLIARMRNQPEDRHVLAAAAASRADFIVTRNVRHFPPDALTDLPVGDVITPDAFLCALHDTATESMTLALERLLARKTRPPMTVADLAKRLVRSGAPAFGERLVPAMVSRHIT